MFNNNQSSVIKYPDPIKISLDKISGMKYLCEGTFGEIYSGTYADVNIVVKKPKLGTELPDREAIEGFFSEFEFLRANFHRQSEYIVKLIGYNSVGSFHLVLEYMSEGDLGNFLNTHRSISWNIKISLLTDAGNGLKELHSYQYPYAHRDIKITNILVKYSLSSVNNSFSYSAKLTDFGTVLAVDIEDKEGKSYLKKDVLSYVDVIGNVAEFQSDNSESTSSQKKQSEEVPKPISTLLAKFGYRASGSPSDTENICIQNVLDYLNEAKTELLNLKK